MTKKKCNVKFDGCLMIIWTAGRLDFEEKSKEGERQRDKKTVTDLRPVCA